MKVGTKSILFGVHCFFIHPFFVAAAWIKLYGFPWNPAIWVAFFVHDLGYWGKPNMDGEEGEKHVILGAKIMHFLFDWRQEWLVEYAVTTKRHTQLLAEGYKLYGAIKSVGPETYYRTVRTWHDFSLYHSRFYAKSHNVQFSKLCVADKYSFCLEPYWFYKIRAIASGEIKEYMQHATANSKYKNENLCNKSIESWHASVKTNLNNWVEQHKHGNADFWTNEPHLYPHRHVAINHGHATFSGEGDPDPEVIKVLNEMADLAYENYDNFQSN